MFDPCLTGVLTGALTGAAGDPAGNNPQMTYKARRIYVGNLPSDPPVTDVMLREFFDQVRPDPSPPPSH